MYYMNQNVLLNKNLQEAQHINDLLTNMHDGKNKAPQATETNNAQITDWLTLSGCLQDVTEFAPQDFLYAESDGNYVTIHYTKRSQEKELLLRATMSQIEEAFSAMPQAVRCHRAFLVNIDKVEKVSGNAQGLRLRIDYCNEEVPVSRAHVNKVKQLLGNNL